MALQKAFVCSDPDLIKFGVTKKVTDVLDSAGLAYEIYSNIKPNPTIENVQTGVAAFKKPAAPTTSSPSAAAPPWIPLRPSASSSPTPSSPMCARLEGVAPTKNKCVFIIAVPTTAGTAAEVTINYVITDVEKKRKFVCVDPHDIPVVAVVDPDMMSSMPKGLTAATGMDALTHAIEGYITKGAWEMSDMFHLKAIEIISRSLRSAVAERAGGHAKAWLWASMLPAWASPMSVWASFTPWLIALGAVYDTPHGVANAIILPTVMEYNADATGEKYSDIATRYGRRGRREHDSRPSTARPLSML